MLRTPEVALASRADGEELVRVRADLLDQQSV
jgi:hypothetical protein